VGLLKEWHFGPSAEDEDGVAIVGREKHCYLIVPECNNECL
jgi:hypothetical protein